MSLLHTAGIHIFQSCALELDDHFNFAGPCGGFIVNQLLFIQSLRGFDIDLILLSCRNKALKELSPSSKVLHLCRNLQNCKTE